MLKCYCDRCKKETTVKFVNLQIKMKGASNISTKHLCPTCWGRVMDVLDNIQPEVGVEPKRETKSRNTELEEKFLSTCYGVDAGKICSLHDANWVPQDIADETGKSLDIVFTIIDMYELYSEVPNTKECTPKVYVEEAVEEVGKVEKSNSPEGKYKESKTKVPALGKKEKIKLEPYLIEEYISTLGAKAHRGTIKEILLDMCTGLHSMQEVVERYKLDYPYVSRHYKNYVRYCVDHSQKDE